MRTTHTQQRHLVVVIRTLIVAAALTAPMTIAHASSGGYPASDVLGQLTNGAPDFTTSSSGTTADSMHYPDGVTIDTVHHRLFVADGSNNRVLVYNLDSHNNLIDHTADNVIGQPDFTSQAGQTTRSGMNFPYIGLAYDAVNDRLFVSDANNNRILAFNLSGGITNGMDASYVLGQSGFTSSASALSQAGLFGPTGLAYDPQHQRLFVSDSTNYRVVVYDVAPGSIANGMNASYVIGQPDFTSSTTAVAQDGLSTPYPVAYNDVTHNLFVGDNGGQRVMVFDLSSGITNGMNASYVLGQSDFAASAQFSPPLRSTTMSVESLAVDTSRNIVYVQDDANNRVVGFDLSGGITNGMDARIVLGQTGFGGSDYTCPTPTSTNLCDSEGGLAVDQGNNRLYITDAGYNRVMVYDFAHFTTASGPLAAATLNQPYSFAVPTSGRQGVLTFSRLSGTLPPGLSFDPLTGIISGTPTQTGSYTFELALTDDLGDIGSVYDDPSYTITVSAAGNSSTAPGAPNTGLLAENNSVPILALISGSVIMLGIVIRRLSKVKNTIQ